MVKIQKLSYLKIFIRIFLLFKGWRRHRKVHERRQAVGWKQATAICFELRGKLNPVHSLLLKNHCILKAINSVVNLTIFFSWSFSILS